MSLLRVGGSLVRVGGAIGRAADAPSGDRTLLTMADLTYVGAARVPGIPYANFAMAIRYVGGDRRILSYVRDLSQSEAIGDLIEFRMATAFATGTVHAALPEWTETRRWRGWHNAPHADFAGTVFGYQGGNGAEPTMFHWDEPNHCLRYAWQPNYPGGDISFANMGYVVLDDAEARAAGATSGPVVSAGNKSAPLFFRSSAFESFKNNTQGITPIPADRQADFGGRKYLTFGGNCSNINASGARGLSIWSIPEFPTISPPPASLSSMFPAANQIYDPSPASGVVEHGMRRPANTRLLGGGVGDSVMHRFEGGTYTYDNTLPNALGLNVGDILYCKGVGGAHDVVVVRMNTPASGGAYVYEVWNGSAWATPPGFTVHQGSLAMDAVDGYNVFYFDNCPIVNMYPAAPQVGMEAGHYWVRFRRTVAGTSGGSFQAAYSTTSVSASFTGTGTDRPNPVGGYIADAAAALAAYGPSSHGFCYGDYAVGACFIQTSLVEGLLGAGKFGSKGRWYGNGTMWARPTSTSGAPEHHVDSTYGTEVANGQWASGTNITYFFTFDIDQVAECDAGTRPPNASGLQPVAYYALRDHAAFPVFQNAIAGSLDAGTPNDDVATHFGQAMVFDPVAEQVIFLFSRGGGVDPMTLVFNVRGALHG